MELKDYYKILDLEPSATTAEIKKAYRKLAHQFHPDKNSGDQYAVIQFSEIKEAYEVLTNPSKKNYYLQQRWYQQSLGKTRFKDRSLTPPEILKQFLELDKYISTLDAFRMDQEGLYRYMTGILSSDTIEQLKKFNEPAIIHEITRIVLRVAGWLGESESGDIAQRLINLTDNEETIAGEIDLLYKRIKEGTSGKNTERLPLSSLPLC